MMNWLGLAADVKVRQKNPEEPKKEQNQRRNQEDKNTNL